MSRMIKIALAYFFVFTGVACAESFSEESIIKVLNDFHQAAANADGEKYFSLLAEDAVFIGTDATERWKKAQFLEYTEPYFSKSKGWTYLPRDRHLAFSASGKVAWFDELLDNEKYGECRGTGVLALINGQWLIRQYHLTIPVPNALAAEMAVSIKKLKSKGKK